jgi:hypothetical protein
MQTSKTRLMAITGATLALVVGTTAAVSAAPGDRFEEDSFRKGRIGAEHKQRFSEGRRGGGMLARGAMRGHAMRGIGGMVDDFVRTETTLQTDDGLITKRVDNGTVSSAADAGLEYTLSTGDSATVTTDEDTKVVAFSEQTVEVGRRGLSRERMVPEEVAIGDIEAGSEVIVWAESADDGTFIAQRIVVQPDLDEATDTEADAADTDAAAAEEAVATDA